MCYTPCFTDGPRCVPDFQVPGESCSGHKRVMIVLAISRGRMASRDIGGTICTINIPAPEGGVKKGMEYHLVCTHRSTVLVTRKVCILIDVLIQC